MLVLFLGLLACASGLRAPPTRLPKQQLDVAFANWHEEQHSQGRMHREVNRLSHPDVPLWLVFEGLAQPTVLRGSAKTDAIHSEAARLHNLDARQRLRFVLEGQMLPPGMAISESPLANSKNMKVHVMPCEWPVKRGYANPSSSFHASTASAIPATRLRRGTGVRRQTLLRTQHYNAGDVQAAYNRQQLAANVLERYAESSKESN